MVRIAVSASAFLLVPALVAQPYTSYFTGSPVDVSPAPLGGTCMMGGATEHDGAMAWFLQRANGGDVVVLRASGSDGYNDYLYSVLGGINSVETIVFNQAEAAAHPYVLERIDRAEAIWFAGGDQWNYVSYWRGSPVAGHVNQAIAQRNVAVGGTSAGMAILGSHYFTAQNGTVSSATALADPYAPSVTVSDVPFLVVPFLHHVITDTHYDDPDRRGRHTVFLARMAADQGIRAQGIACNEYVAVTIDPGGTARVWGEWPDYQEYAFFLRVNCVEPAAPETCMPGQPLTWQRDGQAVKVYKVPGLMQGGNWFDLNDWMTGSGGSWEHWTVQAGSFSAQPGTAPACDGSVSIDPMVPPVIGVRWDRERRRAALTSLPEGAELRAFTAEGRRLALHASGSGSGRTVDFPACTTGLVLLQAVWPQGSLVWRSGF
ncbi:MAG: cyanophycinase [Flavobacteriales bacterium]|nr:cyanophycinase [Flavobacteriales bacterium]MEB2341426.1 cyanophycinase [Flavobacteriia bacterium]